MSATTPTRIGAVGGAMLFWTVSAATAADATTAARRHDPAQYAGPLLTQVRFSRLEGWTRLGDTQLALRDVHGDLYLVTVAPPCKALSGADALAITAQGHRLAVGLDEVVVDGRRCAVQRLSELDAEAMAAAGALPAVDQPLSVRPRAIDRGPLTPPPPDD